jgi:hypothetical protein
MKIHCTGRRKKLLSRDFLPDLTELIRFLENISFRISGNYPLKTYFYRRGNGAGQRRSVKTPGKNNIRLALNRGEKGKIKLICSFLTLTP